MMKKININFSIILNGISIGDVIGVVDLLDTPVPGDMISFMFPQSGHIRPHIDGFNGWIRVSKRIFHPLSIDSGITLLLDDVTVNTENEGITLMDYLSVAFKLSSTN